MAPCGLWLWGPSTVYLLLSDLQCAAFRLQAVLQNQVTVQGRFWHLLPHAPVPPAPASFCF